MSDSEIDKVEWSKLYTPLERILEYAQTRSIPSSYVRIREEDGKLTDLLRIAHDMLSSSSIMPQQSGEVQTGSTASPSRDPDVRRLLDFNMEDFRSRLDRLRTSETTAHRRLFYANSHRDRMYMHCFMDGINSLKLSDFMLRIMRSVCDVMYISWTSDFTEEEITSTILAMNNEVTEQVEICEEDLEFLQSHHTIMYQSIFGDHGTGITVHLECRSIVKSIYSFAIEFKDWKCVEFLQDVSLKERSGSDVNSGSVVPTTLYDEINPTKYLPILELKYRGRIVNKVYVKLLTSALRAMGRIDKQTKTAMLAYPAMLVGNALRYTKLIFPEDSKYCHAVLDGYGKKCTAEFFDRQAESIRTIMNRHLESMVLANHKVSSSTRKVVVRGLEGIEVNVFCDAIMTTANIRDVLFIRELNRVLEQSVTLFMELKFPLEKHISATLSFKTSSKLISECTVMVKGRSRTFAHVLGYIERILSIAKAVMVNYTVDLYAAFENSKYDGDAADLGRTAESTVEPQGDVAEAPQASNRDRKKKLMSRAPDLFATGYARACQSDRQPLIIEEDEAEGWINKKILHKGEMIPRSLLQMEVASGKILMVCPNDKMPFPHLKNNTIREVNKVKCPDIPCCQTSGRFVIPPNNRFVFPSQSLGGVSSHAMASAAAPSSASEYLSERIPGGRGTGDRPKEGLRKKHKKCELLEPGGESTIGNNCCLEALKKKNKDQRTSRPQLERHKNTPLSPKKTRTKERKRKRKRKR